MPNNLVKVYFDLDTREWHGGGREGLWAKVVSHSKFGDTCQLVNSPFYTRAVSFLDVVRIRPSADHSSGALFVEAVWRSGHSTYMVLTPPASTELESIWQQLEEIGCTYESTGIEETIFGKKNLYTIDVPPSTDVNKVYRLLDEGEKSNILMFQEGYFGHRHKNSEFKH